jgi:DUF177 domain-containing protein
MIIQVAELPEEGLTFTDVGQFPSVFADAAWRLDGVDLTLTPDGSDVLVHGRIDATIPQACGRCLESFPAIVAASVDVRLTPRPATKDTHELGEDDLDVDFYVGGELDLDRLIDAETTLALPMKPLCRTDCRGLCPVCGVNRNVTSCDCSPRPADPRLAVLKQLTARPER